MGAPEKVETVVLVSGRHYYTLAKHIEENKIGNVAVVRLESLCPFPIELLYAGRAELCQPAVGVGQVHRREADQLLEDTFSFLFLFPLSLSSFSFLFLFPLSLSSFSFLFLF